MAWSIKILLSLAVGLAVASRLFNCSLPPEQTEQIVDRTQAVEDMEKFAQSNAAIPTPPPPLPTPGEGDPTPGFPFVSRDLAALTQPGSSPDQTALYIFLKGLQHHNISLEGQSALLLDPDGEVLAAYQPRQLVPAAGMMPLAISVAAQDWGDLESPCPIDVFMTGTVKDSTLQGDLWIKTHSEPYFDEKDAANLVEKLNQQGIRKISGTVYVTSSLKPTAANTISGLLLAQPNFSTERAVVYTSDPTPLDTKLLLEENTQLNLQDILKAQNFYSQLAISQALIEELGGTFELRLTLADYLDPSEFQLSSEYLKSQFSAQALAQLLIALTENETLEELLPESGSDISSLGLRNLPPGSHAISGASQGVVSVAGQLPDGKIFVLINQGSDFETLRTLQDRFLQDVVLLDQPTR